MLLMSDYNAIERGAIVMLFSRLLFMTAMTLPVCENLRVMDAWGAPAVVFVFSPCAERLRRQS